MKVNLLRSGGFAGLRTGWEVQVDEQADADQWLTLVDACPWDEPAPPDPGNDRYIYELRVDDRRTVLGEGSLRGPWRSLADRVREQGRRIPPAELGRLG